MSLSALPAELKLGVVHYLDPESTLWLALTCKDHATLCKTNLQAHAQRLAERQCIDTHQGDVLLWQFLLEVLEDPSKGWYVRELNLPSTRQYNWQEDDLDTRPAPAQPEQDVFRGEAQKLQELYPVLKPGDEKYCSHAGFAGSNDMIATIQDRIHQGYEDGIIILLLHHLPLLDTIRLTAIDDEGLELALYRITREYRHSSTAPSKLPLRHLKTAAIAHWDTEFCCNADWACNLQSLPSLNTLVARQMGDEASALFHDENSSPGFVPGSNVTELFLQQCQFEAEHFGTILANIKSLKKFTYVSGGATVSYNAFEPRKIIKALSDHAGENLEEMYLNQEDYGDDMGDETDLRITTFLPFKRLRILNCAWHILRPLEDDEILDNASLDEGFYTADSPPSSSDVFDVRTILPPSLEKLYLHGLFDEGSEGTQEEWELFEHMFDEPSALTPKLTRESVWIGKMARVGWGVEARIGEAEEPVPHWSHPLAGLLEGHGQ